MTDILTIPTPEYCTAQRFNLWLQLNQNEPIRIGVPLVKSCALLEVNPFVLGCIASVLSNKFTTQNSISNLDYFNTGGKYKVMTDSINEARGKALSVKSLDRWVGLDSVQVSLVREMYAKFVKFCEAYQSLPMEDMLPLEAEIKQAQTVSPWKQKAKLGLGALGALVTAGGFIIPDQYEFIIKAAIEAAKALLNL